MGSVFVSGGAPLASPAFTGTPTAPTATAATDTTQIATTEFTHDAIAAQAGVSQWLTIPITTTPTGAAQDSGYDLPLGAVVLFAMLETTVAEVAGTIKTMRWGTLAGGNDWIRGAVTDAIGFSYSSLGDFTIIGDLIGGAFSGSQMLARVGSAERRVYYTAGSANWTAWRGKIHILYFNPPA